MVKKEFNFNSNENDIEKFDPILPIKKERVTIAGEDNFSSNSFDGVMLDTGKSKRGRPVEITDARYKVRLPKKISPALNVKLKVLEDYITELQSEGVKRRITFEQIVDTLAESYITNKLGVAKEEYLRMELKEEMEKIK